MDMSKLPRMSQTPPPPSSEPQHQPAGSPAARDTYDTPESNVAEVWISAALGVILMLMGRTFAAYLLSLLTGSFFHTGVIWQTGPKAGTEVSYPELQGFPMLTDASMFLFGLVLLLDAVVLYFGGGKRVWIIALGFAATVLVTAFNTFVSIKLLGNNITPILSLLAVAFGVYIAIRQWRYISLIAAFRRTPGG